MLKELGRRCKRFREDLGLLQSDVARDTGYAVETVSSFECGRNNNAMIYAWYVDHGLGGDTNGKEL